MALKLTVILLILLFAVMRFGGQDTGSSPFAEYPGANLGETPLAVAPLDLPPSTATTPDRPVSPTAFEAASPATPATVVTTAQPVDASLQDSAEIPAIDTRSALDLVVIDPNAAVNALTLTDRDGASPAPSAQVATPRDPVGDDAPATPPRPLAEVTGTAVNLRAGPSTGTAVLGRAISGDVVEWLSNPAPGWALIRHPDFSGDLYMSSNYLRRLAN